MKKRVVSLLLCLLFLIGGIPFSVSAASGSSLTNAKLMAIASIDAAIRGETNEEVIAVAEKAKLAVDAAKTLEAVEAARNNAIALILEARAEVLNVTVEQALKKINTAMGSNPSQAVRDIAEEAKAELEKLTDYSRVASILERALEDIRDQKLFERNDHSPALPFYAIEVSDRVTGGRVRPNAFVALVGSTVTVDILPDYGKVFKSLTAVDCYNRKVKLTEVEFGRTYSFTMPSGMICISAEFGEEEVIEPKPLQPTGEEEKVPEENCPLSRFSDTEIDAWYHDGVHYCLEAGWMQGVSENEFDPDGLTCRGMVVTILWRMAGSPVVSYLLNYDDVRPSGWYTEAIRWATSVGIVKRKEYGSRFEPEGEISREEMALMLYRYAVSVGKAGEDLSNLKLDFADAGKIGTNAFDGVCWCTRMGVVNGKENNLFDPQGSASRAELATMIMRLNSVLAD